MSVGLDMQGKGRLRRAGGAQIQPFFLRWKVAESAWMARMAQRPRLCCQSIVGKGKEAQPQPCPSLLPVARGCVSLDGARGATAAAALPPAAAHTAMRRRPPPSACVCSGPRVPRLAALVLLHGTHMDMYVMNIGRIRYMI